MTDWTSLIREVRALSGSSQRALARRVGVPPSTVHRIETGQMSPTVEMLDRLLAGAQATLVIHIVLSVDAVATRTDLNESERRSLALGLLAARHLLLDPVAALARARRNLVTMRAAASAANEPYLAAWQRLLDGPTGDVLDALTADHQQARDLRQATPFAGVVPESERREVLRKLRGEREEPPRACRQFATR